MRGGLLSVFVLTVLSTFALLSGSIPANASSGSPVSLSVQGVISNSGLQLYSSSGGLGDLVYAAVDGQAVAASRFSFSVVATVTGSSAQGDAQITLSGVDASGPVNLTAYVQIEGMIPAESFPLGCGSSVKCTSAIPGFFQGVGLLKQPSGHGQKSHSTSTSVLMSLESAFLNPFGGALVFVSDDATATAPPSIVIVSSYSQAVVYYAGVQTSGKISGSLGGSQAVSGTLSMTTYAGENLLAGTESEVGTVSFTNVSPSDLDLSGTFTGSSAIPAPGPGSDCSSQTGFPGTCTLTGFFSTGSFVMSHSDTKLTGSYSIQWDTPAVSFCNPSSFIVSEGGPCTITATLVNGRH